MATDPTDSVPVPTPDTAALTLPVVRRRPVSLDTAEVPCMDCHVGEPHVCPLLYWDTVTITEDEWGGYVVN